MRLAYIAFPPQDDVGPGGVQRHPSMGAGALQIAGDPEHPLNNSRTDKITSMYDKYQEWWIAEAHVARQQEHIKHFGPEESSCSIGNL